MSELLKINVNDHTEKKGQLTYLSWAWAWAEVLKIDPKATWVAHEFMNSDGPDCPANPSPCMVLRDDSAIVKVSVSIKGDSKTCLLPVMDNKNKAIKGPDAFAVNTAIMRCLAKAIAMHGLGLYIYAGEDLPEGDAGMAESVQAEWVTFINDSATAGDLKKRLAEAVAAAMEVNDSRAVDKFNAAATAKAATAKAKATA